MKFFKRDEMELSAADRAKAESERLGNRALMKLHTTSHLQSATWVAGTIMNVMGICLLNNPLSSNLFVDAVALAGWMGAWRANKASMKMFVRQLSAIEKTPELNTHVRDALSARRQKAGFKPFVARDKTALFWVGMAAVIGLAPASSFLYEVHTRKTEAGEDVGKMAGTLRDKWSRKMEPSKAGPK